MRQYRIVRRASRFSVVVDDGAGERLAHLTNSGRLGELVFAGNPCLCVPKRSAKTEMRLVGVPLSRGRAVLVDPSLQSECFADAADAGLIPWMGGWRVRGARWRAANPGWTT